MTTERKIENLFFREDFRRVDVDEVGAIEVLENRIQLCPKKGAVSFLNEDGVGSSGRRFAPSVPSMTMR